MADLESRLLFESRLVRITDVHCRAHKSGPGEEELTESPRLIFPRRGVFECYRNGEATTADCNTVLLFNQDDVYRIAHPADAGDDCSVLVFPPEVLNCALAEDGLSGPWADFQPFPTNHVVVDPRTLYCQRLFHHLLRQDVLDTLGKEEAAALVLSLVAGQVAQGSKTLTTGHLSTVAERRRLAEQARALLAGQPEADSSLHEIADQLYCSPFHLARLFHAEVGVTLHHYRLRLRLGQALERLSQGEENLTLLALDLGFSSHSHFSASFKRFFGRTPNQVRSELTRRRLHELGKILIAS